MSDDKKDAKPKKAKAEAAGGEAKTPKGPPPSKADEKRECGLHAAWGGKAADAAGVSR